LFLEIFILKQLAMVGSLAATLKQELLFLLKEWSQQLLLNDLVNILQNWRKFLQKVNIGFSFFDFIGSRFFLNKLG
jgi:hypothetical protein